MLEIIFTSEEANRRLDKYLFQYLNNAPHSFIYKMLRQKRIKYNGKKAAGNEIITVGDRLSFYLSPETIQSCIKPYEIPEAGSLPEIIFEDENWLIINKPAGLPSHGGMRGKDDHLLARVHYYLQSAQAALCNRLDINTSGLVVCGKNYQALQSFNRLMANQKVIKEYIAVVHGKLTGGDRLENGYKKDLRNNKAVIDDKSSTKIITQYDVIKTGKNYSLLHCQPITGRSHQIRAHLAFIGHPLAGDKKYGGKPTKYTQAQLLHSHRIHFMDKTYEAQLPNEYKLCLKDWFSIDEYKFFQK